MSSCTSEWAFLAILDLDPKSWVQSHWISHEMTCKNTTNANNQFSKLIHHPNQQKSASSARDACIHYFYHSRTGLLRGDRHHVERIFSQAVPKTHKLLGIRDANAARLCNMWAALSMTKTISILFSFRGLVLLAVAIPNIELFISLFGALCLSALGLAFPAMIQTCVFWNHTKGWKKAFMVVRNVIITIAAVVGLVSGTTQSIIEIVHTFFK